MISPTPLVLERVILQYFHSRKQQPVVRAEFFDIAADELATQIREKLELYADCFLLRHYEGKREKISLCTSKDIPDLIYNTVKFLDIISFIFDKGSLVFSADKNDNQNIIKYHLVAEGAFMDDLSKISEQFGTDNY